MTKTIFTKSYSFARVAPSLNAFDILENQGLKNRDGLHKLFYAFNCFCNLLIL